MAEHRRSPEALAVYSIGLRRAEQCDYESGRRALEEAVSIDPEFGEAHVALGRVFSKLGDAHGARLHISFGKWLLHRAILEPYRVRPGDRRTTAPPVVDVAELFPELAGRSTTTVRLHPRYGEEPPPQASKMGGTFLWPAKELWPICPTHGIPFVGVLQLRADDFPEMPFPPGADLFQMLWCPREHDAWPMCWADPKFFWRKTAVRHPLPGNPPPTEAFYEYVPFPCRLLPERVVEFPSVYELSDELTERIYAWQDNNPDENGKHAIVYEWELSVCPSTKVGGYVHVIQSLWIPICDCGRAMEHLLTVSSRESGGLVDRRWTPLEEQQLFASLPPPPKEWIGPGGDIRAALWMSTGLDLGDGGHM